MGVRDLVLVGQRGTITIPMDIRRSLGLEAGARLRPDLVDGALVLRPVRVIDDESRARRRKLIEDSNAGYALLREDKVEWDAHLRERAEWDATLSDGLEADDV